MAFAVHADTERVAQTLYLDALTYAAARAGVGFPITGATVPQLLASEHAADARVQRALHGQRFFPVVVGTRTPHVPLPYGRAPLDGAAGVLLDAVPDTDELVLVGVRTTHVERSAAIDHAVAAGLLPADASAATPTPRFTPLTAARPRHKRVASARPRPRADEAEEAADVVEVVPAAEPPGVELGDEERSADSEPDTSDDDFVVSNE